MIVSTQEILPLTVVTGFSLPSTTLKNLAELLTKNPEKVSLDKVLACFGDALYKDARSITPKKVVLDKIILKYLEIPHKTLVEDFKYLPRDNKDRENWITFCYFMKGESRINPYNRKEIIDQLHKINNILTRFSQAGILNDENLKIIKIFLESSCYKPIITKLLKEIINIPLNYWLFFFGGKVYAEIDNEDFITKVNSRYDTLPAEASLSTKNMLLNESLKLEDADYSEMLDFMKTLQQNPGYPDLLRDNNLQKVRLFQACITLQKVKCLSVLEQCLRINALPNLISILHGLEITPNFAKFSDENLSLIIKYYQPRVLNANFQIIPLYQLKDYDELIDPTEKMPFDLTRSQFTRTGTISIPQDWGTFYSNSTSVENILYRLISLEKAILFEANCTPPSIELYKILLRNNWISQFFPDFKHAAVVDALRLSISISNTSFFVISLLLANAELDSYLYELYSKNSPRAEDLTIKLVNLHQEGRLNCENLREIIAREISDPHMDQENSGQKLCSYLSKNEKFEALSRKYENWQLYFYPNQMYTAFQCLEKIDQETRHSIKNTFQLFQYFYDYQRGGHLASMRIIALLEDFATNKKNPIRYENGGREIELVLMDVIFSIFTKRKDRLEESYNKIKIMELKDVDLFFKNLNRQIFEEDPRLFVSSKDLRTKCMPSAGASGTLKRLDSLLQNDPFVSLLTVFHCFDKILAQQKKWITLTGKWEVLEAITKEYLHMSYATLGAQLSAFKKDDHDDWIRICYLTGKANIQGESLWSLIKTRKPPFFVYQILTILCRVDAIDEEDIYYIASIFRNLSIDKLAALTVLSPARVTLRLNPHFLLAEKYDSEEIEKKYQTLPNASLKIKNWLLMKNKDSYQTFLVNWSKVREDLNYQALTPGEEKKWLKMYYYLEINNRLDLFEQCLRLHYLQQFNDVFSVEDIKKNFAILLSDQELINLIDYRLTLQKKPLAEPRPPTLELNNAPKKGGFFGTPTQIGEVNTKDEEKKRYPL